MTWLNLTNGLLKIAQKSFGEDVVYRPKALPEFEIRGIFDNGYRSVSPEGGTMVQSAEPTLGVLLSDFIEAPTVGDKVEIRLTVYSVREVKQDGQGGATLRLHRV